MPKQPLRTNQIVSKLKAASSPVIYGTATNAIDALQLSLDSPTPISAWVCQTNEGEKSLSVIDLGSSAYLGLDIDPKLGYINCYLASGAIIGNGDKGNQIKGPMFHFLSREDVNDTATQLINAGESKEIVNPNPSAEATATLEKLQVGETVYGIEKELEGPTTFTGTCSVANWVSDGVLSITDSDFATFIREAVYYRKKIIAFLSFDIDGKISVRSNGFASPNMAEGNFILTVGPFSFDGVYYNDDTLDEEFKAGGFVAIHTYPVGGDSPSVVLFSISGVQFDHAEAIATNAYSDSFEITATFYEL